ncbi:MAG: LysR family transcriptional regulator [Acidimicrobiaceae bacterium]|nr:MAG: LysR family transcriptional regulator [Acidimicrobiaceae bacterium]
MDLRQLNHLIAVAEHQSFSAAARALHTVQSNVSTHVAKLEKELGAALIDRHTMQPTAEGRAVLERARRIRTELQAINDDIVSMRHEVAGEVRIGCIGTTGRWMASPLLGRLAERHPALRPVLVEATTTSLTPRVLDGDLDMAIVNTPVVEAGLESKPLFDEERIIVAPADHSLADRGTIDVADLAEHPVCSPPRYHLPRCHRPGTGRRRGSSTAAAEVEASPPGLTGLPGLRTGPLPASASLGTQTELVPSHVEGGPVARWAWSATGAPPPRCPSGPPGKSSWT